MTERPTSGIDRSLTARLAASRLATRVVMMVERAWPLILPFLLVLALFVSAAWLGLFPRLSDITRLGLVGLFGVAALASLYPLRLFRLPTASEVDTRIEAANALLHSPVRVQTDKPGGEAGDFAQALWREHQKRMAAKLGSLGTDLPSTGVARHDPWAVRAVVALLLFVALAFSYGPQGGRLSDAFLAAGARDAVPPRIDAWVTPPNYTGKPPVFLTADATRKDITFTVPQGSDVTVRITGGADDETVVYDEASGNSRDIKPDAPAKADDAAPSNPAPTNGARQFNGKLITDGVLVLKSANDELGRWAFAVTPDTAPQIRFSGEPRRAANGTAEINYEIVDDYGPAKALAEFKLAEQQAPDARPLYGPPEMPLSLPRRGAKNNAARTTKDLTDHVWAGAGVKVTLEATDGAGQIARSETKSWTLPERPFANPLARAVIEQRRLLALDANAKRRVLDLMDAITLRPEDTFDSMPNYLGLMSARSRLNLAKSDDELRGVVSYLWDLALGIENGSLSDAEKRLRQAQQALQDALQNGASDEEIDKLMKELRQAMADFMREFAQRNPQGKEQPLPDDARVLSENDLKRMMDQIEDLAKSGDRDKAQQLLSELQDMMNNLRTARRQGQGQQNSEMRQQMDKLGEIMRRQQEMMNETFRTDRMQRGEQGQDEQPGDQQMPGQEGQQGNNEGQQNGSGGDKPMTPEEFADALKQLQEGQGKLKSDLEKLKKSLEGMGLEPNEGFGEAGRAMGDAEQSLGGGESGAAVGQQSRALEALRRGAKDMMQQLEAMQGDQGDTQRGNRQRGANRDPLDRPWGERGPMENQSRNENLDKVDTQRAREILDAIRKRLGNALSPEIERSYLERLLNLK
ncbi:TIGR02302 family protein [Mesorhizobium retamae]|uniref:TIGR02302 family protein n=1 Tax=Mesorhizobium retamae TaxID=2912854 RepID=A0ABS9QAN2_9HYPH|nr:TIGR02302 family protein [Mesorhizobium sp. IRAMC:0171]MCG7504472.1 TIGR02302 family protein [Mesorhizobium sp. IRAMC:0171]